MKAPIDGHPDDCTCDDCISIIVWSMDPSTGDCPDEDDEDTET